MSNPHDPNTYATGLDLTQAEDRATLRERLERGYAHTAFWAILDDVHRLGGPLPKSRAEGIRAIANAVIEQSNSQPPEE